MPKFSVVMPVYSARDENVTVEEMRHYRAKTVQRAIKSIINQQFTDWELIIIDDGCTDETPRILAQFVKLDKRIKVFHQENSNRAIARNNGMFKSKGEWICWLDCDDEYSSHYLRELNEAIKDYPNYKMFNFGSLLYWPDHHSTIRPVFAPAIEAVGHEWFKSGHIGTGSFIFRRDLWESDPKYRIPDEPNPYQFAATSRFDLKMNREEDEFRYDNTENPEGALTDGVYRHGTSLGNPWGDDFLQFYLLTRDNWSMPLDVLLYIQYPRAHEERYSEFGEIYDVD